VNYFSSLSRPVSPETCYRKFVFSAVLRLQRDHNVGMNAATSSPRDSKFVRSRVRVRQQTVTSTVLFIFEGDRDDVAPIFFAENNIEMFSPRKGGRACGRPARLSNIREHSDDAGTEITGTRREDSTCADLLCGTADQHVQGRQKARSQKHC
jgi:hypothetical protein